MIHSVVLGQAPPSQLVAEGIANRMKDSLALNAAQKDSILVVNLQLHSLKVQARSQYTNLDTLQIKIQRIESYRDSLYRPILAETKYQLYLEKKGTLVSN
jgi:hypothetical protein